MSECEHAELELSSAFHVPSDADWQYLAISARCAQCKQQFAWRGLNSGQPNPREPVTSADGYELRAPITPNPTGVVGLLRSAGLEHLLGKDGPTEA